MIKSSFRPAFILTVVAVFIIFFDSFLMRGFFSRFFINIIAQSTEHVFVKSHRIKLWVGGLKSWDQLISENESLKNVNLSLSAEVNTLKEIKEENVFLRKASELPVFRENKTVDGSIFVYNFIPGNYRVLFNRGQKDGITSESVIASGEGVLIGKVTKVSDNFSEVMLITDLNFRTTVRLTDSTVLAIARGAGDRGLILELVAQNEKVSFGGLVTTSGDDTMPKGLLVGQIKEISDMQAVFKKIYANPMWESLGFGKAMAIIK